MWRDQYVAPTARRQGWLDSDFHRVNLEVQGGLSLLVQKARDVLPKDGYGPHGRGRQLGYLGAIRTSRVLEIISAARSQR